MSSITIIDVLENALDGDLSANRASRLTTREVEDLRESVRDFYDSWASYPATDGRLRVHLGGWVATPNPEGLAHDLLHAALLYAHEVVINDPVAAYFEPRRLALRDFGPIVGAGMNLNASAIQQERTGGYHSFEGDLTAHRSHLSHAIPAIASYAELIKASVVIPIPHLKLTMQRQNAIWTAVNSMLTDDDYVALIDNPADRPAITQDYGPLIHFVTSPRTARDARVMRYGDPAYYLARSLAMAAVAYATYMPPSGTEWAIYSQRLGRMSEKLSRREREELILAPALLQSKLPYFRGLSGSDVLGARNDDEAFGLWRARLRNVVRRIDALPAEGEDFVDHARDVLADELDETAREVRHATSRSQVLKRSLRSAALTLVTGVAGAGVDAAASGKPPTLLGPVSSGILRWLADGLLVSSPSGSKAVMVHLVHGHGAVADDWPKREPLALHPKRG